MELRDYQSEPPTAALAKRPTPWAHLGQPGDVPFTDFLAWERWMGARHGLAEDGWREVWEEMGSVERIGLYSVMCAVVDATVPA